MDGVCPRTELIKKQENRPLTKSNPLKTAIFSPNLFLTFSLPVSLCQELPSTPLRLTRTRRSPPSCRLQTAGPESPLQTDRNWSGPPAVLGARSLWRCKQTRRRWTAGSRRSPQCPRPGPIGSKLCRPELLGLSAAVEKWPDGKEEEDYYSPHVNISTHSLDIHLFKNKHSCWEPYFVTVSKLI